MGAQRTRSKSIERPAATPISKASPPGKTATGMPALEALALQTADLGTRENVLTDLQTTAGNAAVQRLVQRAPTSTSMSKDSREADRVTKGKGPKPPAKTDTKTGSKGGAPVASGGAGGTATVTINGQDIAVLSFSLGATQTAPNAAQGKPGSLKFQDLHFVKEVDDASPGLALAAATGKALGTVTVSFKGVDGSEVSYVITGGFISSLSESSGGAEAIESISLHFDTLEFSHKAAGKQGEKASIDTTAEVGGRNFATDTGVSGSGASGGPSAGTLTLRGLGEEIVIPAMSYSFGTRELEAKEGGGAQDMRELHITKLVDENSVDIFGAMTEGKVFSASFETAGGGSALSMDMDQVMVASLQQGASGQLAESLSLSFGVHRFKTAPKKDGKAGAGNDKRPGAAGELIAPDISREPIPVLSYSWGASSAGTGETPKTDQQDLVFTKPTDSTSLKWAFESEKGANLSKATLKTPIAEYDLEAVKVTSVQMGGATEGGVDQVSLSSAKFRMATGGEKEAPTGPGRAGKATFDLNGKPTTIGVESFSWGATNASAGGKGNPERAPVLQDVHLVKNVDHTSPVLAQAIMFGKALGTVKLDLLIGGAGALECELSDATVTSFQQGGSEGASASEQLSLSFSKIAHKHTPDPKAGKDGKSQGAGGGGGTSGSVLDLPGFKGGTKIPMLSFSWGVSGELNAKDGQSSETQDRNVQDLHITKAFDESSIALINAVEMGKALGDGTITISRPDGAVLVIDIEGVQVSSVQQSGAGEMVEQVSFAFGRHKFRTQAGGKPDRGGAGGVEGPSAGTMKIGGLGQAAIPVASFSWGVTNTGTASEPGKSAFTDLTITKSTDDKSLVLVAAAEMAKHLGNLVLETPGTTYQLDDVVATSAQMGGSGGTVQDMFSFKGTAFRMNRGASPGLGDPPPPLTRALRLGTKGDDVAHMQTKLNQLTGSALGTDGRFGPKTLATVREFQGSADLDPDGIVGQKTWAALHPASAGAGGNSMKVSMVENART